jgi:hypothetical protein
LEAITVFPRTIRRNGKDWLASPTGLAHQVDMQWSTQIRFSSGIDEVFGRLMVAPADAGGAGDEELIEALDDAINNPPSDVFPQPPGDETDDDADSK